MFVNQGWKSPIEMEIIEIASLTHSATPPTTIFLRDSLKLPYMTHLYPIHLCVQNSSRMQTAHWHFALSLRRLAMAFRWTGFYFRECSNCWMKQRWWNTFAWWLLRCDIMDMFAFKQINVSTAWFYNSASCKTWTLSRQEQSFFNLPDLGWPRLQLRAGQQLLQHCLLLGCNFGPGIV